MDVAALRPALGPEALAALGAEMHALAAELYPLPRSITGEALRATLRRLGRDLPLAIEEVPSGTPVLDWTVPDEWNLRRAWITAPDGRRIVDTADSNLHVVGYSTPVAARMSLAELRPHLHSLPDQPDLVPYRTSYYREAWGFCLAHSVLESLVEGEYEVVVDTTLAPGSLSYGELVLPGASSDEVLVSCHACHPSLANDNLSGIAVTWALARLLAQAERRLTWRFLWLPGTIGAITWLARNEDGAVRRVRHGLVAAGLGSTGAFHYKRTRRGDAPVDAAAALALRDAGVAHAVEDFVPFGYDERQYGSPGFDLAVGSLTRTPWGRYPEYHTSADDLAFLRPEALAEAVAVYLRVFEILEDDRRWRNTSPKGEPQLGRRGLYGDVGGRVGGREAELALLWVLNLSDGEHGLAEVARRSGIPFDRVRDAARRLAGAGLLVPAAP